ncbi:MAG: hypothetical protein GX606_05685, partial [Elusimicrobia bacterium]|nr:hypothetical protein [Elusimicrobiota bacterium]
MQSIREKVIELLLQMPEVTRADIEAAEAFQQAKGLSFSEALVRRGLITAEDLM